MGVAVMSYLSLYDLTGIQPYIFGSNVLKENLGGSYLVKQALDQWLKEAVASRPGAEFQWSGGGNAMVTTTNDDQARQVATELSRRLHQDAPGLYVACAHLPWDGSDANFKAQQEKLYQQLQAYKAGCWPPAAFDGAGVIAACISTGEPAVKQDKDNKWLGPSSVARLSQADQAKEELQELCPLPEPWVWTSQFDRLGRSRGEQSMLGVIHFDGNNMGQRFKNTSLLEELCELSSKVNQAGVRTLQAALKWVEVNIDGITDVAKGGFDPCRDDEDKRCFPVRPIVYGGDDITLVCDARIALDLATELLRIWHHHTSDLPGGSAHACAGVALVRVHYPFYRAYQMAEQLCQGTKKYLRDHHGESADISALDWEFIASAGLTTLKQRRDSDLYRAISDKQERLHARPYYVIGDPPATTPYRRWDWFRNTLVHALQEQEATHTRFKELASVLHQGASATKIHLDRWRDRFGLSRAEQRDDSRGLWLPEPKSLPLRDGFPNNETPYLDAIELMDRILPSDCYRSVKPAAPAPEESP